MIRNFRSGRAGRWVMLRSVAVYTLTSILIVLGSSPGLALAGSGDAPPRSTSRGKSRKAPRKSAAKERTCTVCEQVEALNREVRELRQQLEANAARPVADLDARQEISQLKTQLKGAEDRAAAAEQASEQLRTELTRTRQSAAATETVIASANLKQTATGTQVEELTRKTNKLESAVERLGGIRFSGDLRLRADAQLRPSLANPGPGLAPLPHIQNIRARYRLRLNFDTDVNPLVAFHGQLATGPINNPQTTNQDFTSTNIRHPFFISEMWVDFHPVKGINLQAGRVQEVFADNSRFLFDDDIRFNGFNQKVVKTFKEPVAGFRSIELRAGQYILSNPNVAVVTDGNLGPTGAMIGSTGRGANMFHQGVLFNQRVSGRASQQFGGDIQLYRNPNQIQFASTMSGLPVIIQGGIGLLLSAPITGTGNATTTLNGPIYTARHFQVARLTYRLDHAGFKRGEREYPISFNLQVARNVGTGQKERDGMLASFKLGEVKKTWDQSFLYVFGLKGANAIISQVTDDDLGTGTGVNMRTHHLRWDVGIMKGVQLQSLLFIQNQLSNSREYPNFFVPLEAYAPRQYKIQEQLVFTF